MFTASDKLLAHGLGVSLEETPSSIRLYIKQASTSELLRLLLAILRRLCA